MLLNVEGISKHFGTRRLLTDVSLSVARGDALGLVGPNGGGKTTLLNIVSRIVKADTGRVVFDGADLETVSPAGAARVGIARIFQAPMLCGTLTVRENVLLGARLSGKRAERKPTAAARDALSAVGLESAADDPVNTLSYFAKRKLEWARALAGCPQLLLLDEPTAGMSGEERRQFAQLLRSALADGVAVILVEHDLTFVGDVCDSIALLEGGSVVAQGNARELSEDRAAAAAMLADSRISARSAAPEA